MQLDPLDAGYVWQIRTAARDAAEMGSGLTLAKLMKDRFAQYAIAKALEVIGEAAAKLSPEFRARHPELPWEKMIGMRHRLVHDYHRTRFDTVWNTLQVSIPQLIEHLDRILPPDPPVEERWEEV